MKFLIQTKIAASTLRPISAVLLPVSMVEGKPLRYGEVFSLLSKEHQRFIRDVIKRKQPKAGESRLLSMPGSPSQVFVVFEKEFTEKSLTLIIRRFVRSAKAEGVKNIAIYLDDFSSKGGSSSGGEQLTITKLARLVSENAAMAHYDFSEQFKALPPDGWKKLDSVTLFTYHQEQAVAAAVKEGELIGEAVNACRTLSNMPPSDIKPEGLAEAARTAARAARPAKAEGPATGGRLSVTVFDEKKLKAMGMNAILAVGAGSASPPRLIIMEYKGGKAKDKPIAFIGKGVTFDSGGLNIKPGEHMADMHMDMSGGAAVIYVMQLFAQLKLRINAVGLIPAVENMPSGLSYRQGDIIKAYGGKTIEIGNTDAEGRVIMSDAIEYAKTKKPALIFGLATLTGSAMIALGMRMAGLFVKDNRPLREQLEKLGEASGDLVWPLPLTADSERDCESTVADVINTNKAGSRYGGASTGAGFLSHFAKDVPFAYIDMAPRMTTLSDEEVLSRGATGFGVRYFLELAQNWNKVKDLI